MLTILCRSHWHMLGPSMELNLSTFKVSGMVLFPSALLLWIPAFWLSLPCAFSLSLRSLYGKRVSRNPVRNYNFISFPLCGWEELHLNLWIVLRCPLKVG